MYTKSGLAIFVRPLQIPGGPNATLVASNRSTNRNPAAASMGEGADASKHRGTLVSYFPVFKHQLHAVALSLITFCRVGPQQRYNHRHAMI